MKSNILNIGIWITQGQKIVPVITWGKKKKGTYQERYLSKSLCGVNFIINITKGFLENKVETLTIYKLIKSAYNDRYFEK